MSVKQKTNELPKCWQTVKDALDAGIDRIILFGTAGVGKTYAGLNFGELNGGAHRLICTDEMTNADVTGCWQPTSSGSWSWLEGAGIKAWQGNGKVGGRLVIDEIDKAGGDVFATLLAITDSPESARWEHPQSKQVIKPTAGFSVVMTTNIEQMSELPMALKDRFPVAIRINEPHPDALLLMSEDLREYATLARCVTQVSVVSHSVRSTLTTSYAHHLALSVQQKSCSGNALNRFLTLLL